MTLSRCIQWENYSISFSFNLLSSIKLIGSDPFKNHMSLQPQPRKQQPSPSSKLYNSPSKNEQLRQQLRLDDDSPTKTKEDIRNKIDISIDRHETRSTTFSKYVVYHIIGSDKNGPIDVFRRFNEFYKMRVALVKRFPGCFIPSIPEKSISLLDDQVASKRMRYLDDFLRRIVKLPHLYNSEEFQALLRSTEKDLSGTFEKWPNPTSIDIINKYKESFKFLSGKVIDTTVKNSITQFAKLIQRTNVHLYNFKLMIKSLAQEKDKFNKALSPLLTKCLPSLQRNCLSEFIKPEQLIFQQNFLEKEKIASDNLTKNSFWMFYEMIKRQERDGLAFLECIKSLQDCQKQQSQLQIRFAENQLAISEASLNKKSNSQLKYKLQVDNQSIKREKEAILLLTDIITALLAFVQMDRFKKERSMLYLTVLGQTSKVELGSSEGMNKMWDQLRSKSQELMKQ